MLSSNRGPQQGPLVILKAAAQQFTFGFLTLPLPAALAALSSSVSGPSSSCCLADHLAFAALPSAHFSLVRLSSANSVFQPNRYLQTWQGCNVLNGAQRAHDTMHSTCRNVLSTWGTVDSTTEALCSTDRGPVQPLQGQCRCSTQAACSSCGRQSNESPHHLLPSGLDAGWPEVCITLTSGTGCSSCSAPQPRQ